MNFLRKLFHREKHQTGLLMLPYDSRDFDLKFLGYDPDRYEPKHKRLVLDTLTVKKQWFNTCSWSSFVGGKEPDENIPLSVRFFVAMGKYHGLISKDGYANLRSNELLGQKVGVCKEESFPRPQYTSWNKYSDFRLVTPEMIADAKNHRTKTFWAISTIYQVLRTLDERRMVRFGIRWRTSFNMQLSDPWILNFSTGKYVGGHAVIAKGYDLDYHGQKVIICQNSYGEEYGDKGNFYIKFDDFERQLRYYGAFVNLDMDKDIAQFLIENNNKAVQEINSEKVWKIENGKKRYFPDLATFYSHGFLDEEIITDDNDCLPSIEEGKPMEFWGGKHFRVIKAMIMQRKELAHIFQKYFDNLFK